MVCSDCNILLIDELPKEMKHQIEKVEYIDFEFIFATSKYTEIAQIKSIFEGGDII